ncbi:MAG: polysaccharide deacetylase family protein [Anaerolineae bacterium]|nr:polysaccharide deacetylase family protein [Anaerolineae bacterium]
MKKTFRIPLYIGLSILFLLAANACSQTETAATATHPLPSPTASASPTLAPSATPTPPPTPTFTPSPQPTPTWTTYEQGDLVEAPILLYHQINDENGEARYVVKIEDFAAQMQALDDWGYTTIPISMLERVIRKGGKLPPRPVVITFDDGHLDNYTNALPILKAHDFTAVIYIVASRFNSEGFVNVEQLEELIAAGWEIGSHSYSHIDLTLDHSVANHEIKQSRFDIAKVLDFDIRTFAYPFGKFDSYLGTKVYDSGYKAAVGLGPSWKHSQSTLFYLSRIEIHGGWSIEQFGAVLPWSKPAGE